MRRQVHRGDAEKRRENAEGSAAERAATFGLDLTLTLQNLRLTPEERIRKLDGFISGVAKMNAMARIIGPRDATPKRDQLGKE